MGKKSQKLRASETQKSDQAKKKEVEALAAKKAAEEKAAEEKRLAEEKAAEQKRQAEAEAKRVAIESKREQPPFSCRIKSGNAGVLEVKVTLHRGTPGSCINFQPNETEFYLDTLKSSKKYLLRFPYPSGIKVATSPEPEATFEGGILSTLLKITDWGTVKKGSESKEKILSVQPSAQPKTKAVPVSATTDTSKSQSKPKTEGAPSSEPTKKKQKTTNAPEIAPQSSPMPEKTAEVSEKAAKVPKEDPSAKVPKEEKPAKLTSAKTKGRPSENKKHPEPSIANALAMIESAASTVIEKTKAHTERGEEKLRALEVKTQQLESRKRKKAEQEAAASQASRAQIKKNKLERKQMNEEETQRSKSSRVRFSDE